MVHHAGTPHIHVRLRDFLDMLWRLTATGEVRGFGEASSNGDAFAARSAPAAKRSRKRARRKAAFFRKDFSRPKPTRSARGTHLDIGNSDTKVSSPSRGACRQAGVARSAHRVQSHRTHTHQTPARRIRSRCLPCFAWGRTFPDCGALFSRERSCHMRSAEGPPAGRQKRKASQQGARKTQQQGVENQATR